MLGTLDKIFSRHFEIFYFSWKTGFDIKETVCTKCQILFSGKNKKNINMSSAEFAQREVTVN